MNGILRQLDEWFFDPPFTFDYVLRLVAVLEFTSESISAETPDRERERAATTTTMSQSKAP